MKLSEEDADLFFRLMWSLQFYVNQQLQILPEVDSLEVYEAASTEDKLKVRSAVYENLNLLDDFVAGNPAGLSAGELAIVESWRQAVRGDFFIERFLKKGTIFVGGPAPSRVYLVLGLHDSLQDMFYSLPLPIRAQATLLPFKGRIIYDGLLSVYRIYFGGGIRGDLKETYMAAKQQGRIIETLEPGAGPAEEAPPKPLPDWEPAVNQIAETARQLKGSRQAPIQSQAIDLLKASVSLTQAAVSDPDDLENLHDLLQKTQRALARLETVLYRAER
ncbi:MAG TPA: hypothetical protein VF177_17745 [Anaerolineae bacterium]